MEDGIDLLDGHGKSVHARGITEGDTVGEFVFVGRMDFALDLLRKLETGKEEKRDQYSPVYRRGEQSRPVGL